MARLLLLEPHDAVRGLFAAVLRLEGHEVIAARARVDPDLAARVDAVVLEPGSPEALAFVIELRLRRPDVPIVCVTIYPRTAALDALEPVAVLVKPFPNAALQRSVRAALPRPFAPGRAAYFQQTAS